MTMMMAILLENVLDMIWATVWGACIIVRTRPNAVAVARMKRIGAYVATDSLKMSTASLSLIVR